MLHIITRFFEDESRIIYKREFSLKSFCGGEKKYFEYDKTTGYSTGKQFRSKTSVKAYLKKV